MVAPRQISNKGTVMMNAMNQMPMGGSKMPMGAEPTPPAEDEPYEPEAIEMVAKLIMRKIADQLMAASEEAPAEENQNASNPKEE